MKENNGMKNKKYLIISMQIYLYFSIVRTKIYMLDDRKFFADMTLIKEIIKVILH